MAKQFENLKLHENTFDILNQVIAEEEFQSFRKEISSGSTKGDNFMGIIYRINVYGTKKSCEKSELNMILKKMQSISLEDFSFCLDVFFKRESYFYSTILPVLSELQKRVNKNKNEMFNFVKCSKINNADEIIVLEDLCVHGFQLENKTKTLDLNHTKLAIKNLAAFHALSFVLRKHDPNKLRDFADNLRADEEFNGNYEGFVAVEADRAIAAVYDEECKEKLANFKKIAFKMIVDNANGGMSEPYNVLCHGDVWANNIMFKYHDGGPIDIRMLDWQMIKYSSPIVDLTYLFFTSVDETVRRLHFSDLIDCYYAALTHRLTSMDCNVNEVYPEKIYREHLTRILPYGLSVAIATMRLIIGETSDILNSPDILDVGNNRMFRPFQSQDMQVRYENRMNAIVKDFVQMNLI